LPVYLTPRPRFECPLRGRYPCTDDTLRGRLRDCGTLCGTLPPLHLGEGEHFL
jgi:hypothetical protein